MCYPLLMGIGYSVDDSGRLAVLSSAVWLLMMSFGSLATGFTAELLLGYRQVGSMERRAAIAYIRSGSAALVIFPTK
jgi:hypothetical protein